MTISSPGSSSAMRSRRRACACSILITVTSPPLGSTTRSGVRPQVHDNGKPVAAAPPEACAFSHRPPHRRAGDGSFLHGLRVERVADDVQLRHLAAQFVREEGYGCRAGE